MTGVREGDRTRLSSGVEGLDDVLHGGFIEGRNYMLRGRPGAGKTLLGLHYLTTGEGEGLFVNMGEAEQDVRADARAFGFDLEDVIFLDLSPTSEAFVEEDGYDVFPADQVDQHSLADPITDELAERDPGRVFVDPLTQFRYLIKDDYRFRRQVLSFLQFLKETGCTTLFTSQDTAAAPDDDLQFMSDGVVHLGESATGRTVEVTKFRGSDVRSGTHSVRIRDDGMHVYPQLRPPDHATAFAPEQISSGVPEVDNLLGGGIERGTVTLLTGPSGAGKTTLGTQFMKEAAGRGERSVVYEFEESETTYRHRSEAVNIPVEDMIDRGVLEVEAVEALDHSPEEFASMVRHQIEERDARIVMVDGIEGYRLSLQGEEGALTKKLHALARYCKNMGVTLVLVSEVTSITGDFVVSEQDVSYLADNIVFLRYIEFEGRLRKAIGVLKKRTSDFERSLREFEITRHGITVGEPLSQLRGILQGTPEWSDQASPDADTPS